jgi:hypothetical protein
MVHQGDDIMEEQRYGGKNNTFEPIKIINNYNLNFNLGNVIKYVLRDKGSKLEDLKKAVDYLKNEIEKLEPKTNSEFVCRDPQSFKFCDFLANNGDCGSLRCSARIKKIIKP